MREIKFRAWDISKKEYTDNEILIDFNGIPHTRIKVNGKQVLAFTSKYKIERHTGLNDKNGKEIYEGDIVSVEGIVDGGIFEIIWDKYCWNGKDFWDSGQDYPSHLFSENSKIEVIGNIHEQ